MLEVPRWPTDQPRSECWDVHVDGTLVPVIRCDRGDLALWTCDGSCSVEIVARGQTAAAHLRPRRLGITPDIAGQRLAFRLPGPCRALLDMPGAPMLHLFAEHAPTPAPAGARVMAAGTRVHGGPVAIGEGGCLWIERGAVLNAHVRASGAGIRIGGGGMISGAGMPGTKHISCDGCPGLVLSDLTVVSPGGWSVVVGASDGALLEDLRILSPGSGSGTDGIDLVGCSNTRVTRSYVITGDDAIAIKAFKAGDGDVRLDWARPVRDIQVDHCTLGTFGGHCMEIGHELTVPTVEGIAFSDIDVLFAHGFGAPFGIHAGDRARVARVSWNRVTIEHCYHQLLDLRVMRSRYNHDHERGSIADVSFTDIDWWRTEYNAGYTIGAIAGFDADHGVSGVRFTRFRRDGLVAASADDLDLLMRHVDGLVFNQ